MDCISACQREPSADDGSACTDSLRSQGGIWTMESRSECAPRSLRRKFWGGLFPSIVNDKLQGYEMMAQKLSATLEEILSRTSDKKECYILQKSCYKET